MRASLALVPLLLASASAASADAPGQTDPTEPGYAQPPPLYSAQPQYAQPPYAAQPMAVVAPDPEWAIMANRWSIGLALGQSTITNAMSPDAKTDFAIGELTLRYRLRPEWEAEVSLGGGNEKLSDGTQGDRMLTSATIGLRYHFRPADPWNWFLLAGVGGSAVASSTASDADRNAATRPHVQVGAGIEHRWTHFALQAEVRLTAMGEPQGYGDTSTPPVLVGTNDGNTAVRGDPASSTTNTASAGQLTIGASYYF